MQDAHEITSDDVTIDGLQAVFFQKYPDADKQLYLGLFKTISETTLDPSLGVGILNKIKARKTALRLSEAAFKFSTGLGDYDKIVEAYSKFEEKDGSVGEYQFVSDDLEQLLNDSVQKHGLRWGLDFLNKSLGSLRKGDFGFLFARPETGKTTFLASEISAMLKQLQPDSGPVIWFNNEEQGSKVMLRVYQAYFGVRLDQLMSNPQKYKAEFNKQVQGKFLLRDDANSSKHDVERMLKQYEPSLVVFDQISKIKGFAADRNDLELGDICVWAREIAKAHCPVIGVLQAGGSAENQKWLTMDHVANVKTAVQAEADWILGIGKVHSEGAEFLRYMNISKNKLVGDTDTINHLRHGRVEVLIEPDVAKYRDIIKYD